MCWCDKGTCQEVPVRDGVNGFDLAKSSGYVKLCDLPREIRPTVASTFRSRYGTTTFFRLAIRCDSA